MVATDGELVQLCRQQLPYDTSAFEQLLGRHEPVVFRTCMRYLGNQHDAEDAGQEIFLRAFHGLKRFKADSAFRTWLYRIVVNVCITRMQKLAREREQGQRYRDELTDQIEQRSTAATAKLDPSQTWGEAIAIGGPVGAALDSLAEGDRTILILRLVSELSLQELADALEISLSAAKMRLTRAQDRLKEAYQRELKQ